MKIEEEMVSIEREDLLEDLKECTSYIYINTTNIDKGKFKIKAENLGLNEIISTLISSALNILKDNQQYTKQYKIVLLNNAIKKLKGGI